MRFERGIVLRGAAILLGLVLVTGCSQTVRIAADADPGASFGGFHRYAWLPVSPEQQADPRLNGDLLQWRIEAAVDAQLQQRGWQKSDRETADIVVQTRLRLREKTTESIEDYYWYKRTGGSGGPQDSFVFGYQEGSLAVELFDARSSKLLWRASVSAVVEKGQDPQGVLAAIPQLFEQLPR